MHICPVIEFFRKRMEKDREGLGMLLCRRAFLSSLGEALASIPSKPTHHMQTKKHSCNRDIATTSKEVSISMRRSRF